MLVIGGSESGELAEKVSKQLDCDFASVEKDEFPDGEIYVRIPKDVEGERVIVVQSTCYPPNQNYMELFLILDAVRDIGASDITAVIPYFGYARQDKRFEPGEAVSLETVAKLIDCSGANEVFTIDLHAHGIDSSPEVFEIPSQNISAAPVIGRYMEEEYDLEEPVFIGPDEQAEKWARIAAEEIGAEFDYMVKKRLGPKKVEITPRKLDVEDRDVVVIDDIVSTGGTMERAVQILAEHGAKNVFAACTHGIFSGDALKNIKSAGAMEVFSTDTIESDLSKVSVAPVIAEAIRQ